MFKTPMDVAVDSTDSVFVADMGDHSINKFTKSGNLLNWWGGISGTADGRFNMPSAIAVDTSTDAV